MKEKAIKGSSFSLKAKVGLAMVFLACFSFFLGGILFPSTLFSQDGKSRNELARQLHLLNHGQTGDDSLTIIPFQVLSWKPRALYFPNFATAEQCESIINMAKPSLRRSRVALPEGETIENTEGTRTSTGMFISASEDETGVLDVTEEKIARATMLPRKHGEPFNVLRYEIGQKYDSHFDTDINYVLGSSKKSPRVASFLLYLSDVEEGGETAFPFENRSDIDENHDFKDCTGLKVKPRLGDGLLFYSLFPNNTIDLTSLHGSCPVIKGEKWVATKWIKDQRTKRIKTTLHKQSQNAFCFFFYFPPFYNRFELTSK